MQADTSDAHTHSPMQTDSDGPPVRWLELVPPGPVQHTETSTIAPLLPPLPPGTSVQNSGTASFSSVSNGGTASSSVPNGGTACPSSTSSILSLTHDNGLIDPEDFYVARVGWWPDASIMVQIQNRRQTVLQLLRVDPHTGQREVVYFVLFLTVV